MQAPSQSEGAAPKGLRVPLKAKHHTVRLYQEKLPLSDTLTRFAGAPSEREPAILAVPSATNNIPTGVRLSPHGNTHLCRLLPKEGAAP